VRENRMIMDISSFILGFCAGFIIATVLSCFSLTERSEMKEGK